MPAPRAEETYVDMLQTIFAEKYDESARMQSRLKFDELPTQERAALISAIRFCVNKVVEDMY